MQDQKEQQEREKSLNSNRNTNKTNLICQIRLKLEPKNTRSEEKLQDDGFFYKVLEVSKNSRVKRLKGIKGGHIKIKSNSSPVTRWVALEGDPDYKVFETGV